MLTPLTHSLSGGRDLTEVEIAAACDQLLNESQPIAERADFLRALHNKGETPTEIAHFVRHLLTRAVQPDLGPGLLDVCGTGGDKAGLFNISTAVMFVAAACGARIVKHGNRGITSKCGGADVLEALNVRIDLPPQPAFEAAGCCFLFAPLYHPAFRAIAPVRKFLAEEGSATIFNMLGPLLNPARPDYQLSGVFQANLLSAYADVFALLGRRRAWAVHGTGGLDEVSTLGPSEIHSVENQTVRSWTLNPADYELPEASLADLKGGTAAENAALISELLSGTRRGPQRDIVALNAACALVVAEVQPDLAAAITRVNEVLDSGQAAAPLIALQKLSQTSP